MFALAAGACCLQTFGVLTTNFNYYCYSSYYYCNKGMHYLHPQNLGHMQTQILVQKETSAGIARVKNTKTKHKKCEAITISL